MRPSPDGAHGDDTPVRPHLVRHWLVSHLPLIVLVTALAGSVAAYLGLPGLRAEVDEVMVILAEADVTPLRDYLLRYGAWAIVATALLQIVSSLIPPLPSWILGLVNAMLFGFVPGFIITWTTALLAAGICFWVARLIGRPAVEKFVSRRVVERTDHWVDRHGILAVIVGRLIPFINPDILSYAAGLTSMRTAPFLLGIGLGAIPATLLYTFMGARGITDVGWLAVVIGVMTLLGLAAWAWRRGRARYRMAGDAIDRGPARKTSSAESDPPG
jgi:uncharacterized membrane protein YdjX (TVP38/TMEM64 family)